MLKNDEIKKKIIGFISTGRKKWNLSNRTKHRFEQRELVWLKSCFNYLECADYDHGTSKQSKRGRPEMSFKECSERSKRRKITKVCSTYDASLIHKASEKLSKVKCGTLEKDFSLLNGALAMFMDLELSVQKYDKLRSYNEILFGAKYYPSYPQVLQRKKDCYPEGIIVDEKGASIKLQALLDHTSKRILLSIDAALKDFNETDLELIGKWGMDGSTGQQIFNQKWETEGDLRNIDEKAIFMVAYVPLKLISTNSKQVVWKNERPSSVRFCRPLQFEFVKEDKKIVEREYKNVSQQIDQLLPLEIEFHDGRKFVIKYSLFCTMVDGKVVNILTNQMSTRSCNICNVNPKNMNKLSYVKSLKPIEANYSFGLSTLHCWIRFMECLLHIAYNMDFQKSFASKENKDKKQNRKKQIQDEIKAKLGICIDVVRPDSANSNNGNVARKFFEHYNIVAEILNIEPQLIKNFAIILQVIASGREIIINKFKIFCYETAELFVRHYKWYYMPPTIHKVLIHGSDIIQSIGIPIGTLSEEAQESSNKTFKSARMKHSRGFSRKLNNEDVIHYLLLSSDPLISSIRIKSDKKEQEVLKEVLELTY